MFDRFVGGRDKLNSSKSGGGSKSGHSKSSLDDSKLTNSYDGNPLDGFIEYEEDSEEEDVTVRAGDNYVSEGSTGPTSSKSPTVGATPAPWWARNDASLLNQMASDFLTGRLSQSAASPTQSPEGVRPSSLELAAGGGPAVPKGDQRHPGIKSRRRSDVELVRSNKHATSYIHILHLHSTSCLLPPTSYILHPTSYILHPTSYIPHPTSYILHPTSYIPHPTSYR